MKPPNTKTPKQHQQDVYVLFIFWVDQYFIDAKVQFPNFFQLHIFFFITFTAELWIGQYYKVVIEESNIH